MIDLSLALLAARVLAVVVAVTLLRSRVLLSAPTRDGLVLLPLVAMFQPLWAIAAEGGPSAF